ncbi:CREB-regulated transcription coactivator 1-like isoform X1 [Acropora millepora]|uniref:CREB-regulated transcription coactivator 1-like isoform X1 n=1 Tax=Acropora millepora TaxID=45264 RepID=UPI0010FCCB95|nr:CREB-regulated transcription coactivator 1-like isoform X1 [Acropora millepora]
MATPRRFADKIAQLKQNQEAGTRAFEEIMKKPVYELETTRRPPHHQQIQPHYRGGSLPNVNFTLNAQQKHLDLQNALHNLDDLTRHSGDRMPHRRLGGSRPVQFNANNRFGRGGIDTSPYGCHLSPPQQMDPWRERKIASDSALHDSVMRAEVKPKEKTFPSNEMRKVRSPSRPKSCEVPGMMYPSPEHMQATGPSLQIGGANTGGSLPDLTSLQIPSPLSTPIDPEDQGNQTMSPTQPFSMPQRQNLVARRQHSNQQQIRKSPYMPLMDANISPLEDRLQQFQLYPGGNIGNDYGSHGNVPITTSASPTLSPTSSAPITPLFGNMPNSPLTGLTPDIYFKQHQLQQPLQQPNTLSLQQQLEHISMHRPMLNPSMQLPFQSLLTQTPAGIPQNMPSLAHLYGGPSSRVPDLIVTEIDDDSQKPDFAKDISTAMANIGGEDPEGIYSTDDPFQKVVLDPLDVEGLQILSGHEPELADAATEDQFRLDRLGTTRLH